MGSRRRPDYDAVNAAILAWVATFPADDRLAAHLARLPPGERSAVAEAARAVVANAQRFDGSETPLESAEALGRFGAHLRARHPGVSDAVIRRLWGFIIWANR